jgi:hypothetical protein
MRFVKLVNSARKGKRFVATFEDPKKTIHFGSEKGSTYIDHHDKIKRENYLKRHEVNENWNKVNAGSLSAMVLWGKSTNLESNLIRYVKQFDL